MKDEMTVDKLLILDTVKAVLGKMSDQKEGIQYLVAVFVDGDNNLQCLASSMSMMQLLGLLDMAKWQTLEDWAAGEREGDDAV